MSNKIYIALTLMAIAGITITSTLYVNERALNKVRTEEYNQLVVSKVNIDSECIKLRKQLEELNIEKSELERIVDEYNRQVTEQYIENGFQIDDSTDTNDNITDEIQSPTIENTVDNLNNIGYIFIGDSRYVGMNKACNISDGKNKFVIAKVGQGYSYLVNEAIKRAQQIEEENKQITKWKYIICLGVNDLGNKDKYVSTLSNLANTKDLYIESVNPVGYNSKISNATIEDFNNTIKNISNISYIDLYTILKNNGFSSNDGVHYSNETYKDIFDIISNNIFC